MTELEWNIASKAQKNRFAEDAGLIRLSAFDRDLPCWHELPQLWKDRLYGDLQVITSPKKPNTSK